MIIEYSNKTKANIFLIDKIILKFKDIFGNNVKVNNSFELSTGETIVNLVNENNDFYHLIIGNIKIGEGVNGRSVDVKIIDQNNKVLEYFYLFPFIYKQDECIKEDEYIVYDTVTFLVNDENEIMSKYVLDKDGYKMIMNFDDENILEELFELEEKGSKKLIKSK